VFTSQKILTSLSVILYLTLLLHPIGPTEQDPRIVEEPAAENTGENVSADDFDFGAIGFKHPVQEFEKKVLRRALKECQFNQRKTAKLLDLSYDQLRGYMRKYDLNK